MHQSDTKLVKETNGFINKNLQFIGEMLKNNQKLVYGDEYILLTDED